VSEKHLAIAFVSTFTIFPVLAHNPIVKELAKPTLFCLAGNLIISPASVDLQSGLIYINVDKYKIRN